MIAGLKMTKTSQAAILRACVEYAACIAAYHAGFRVDRLEGNLEAAAAVGSQYNNAAADWLRRINRTKATTAEALFAKAALADFIVADDEARTDPDTAEYILSLGRDVMAFCRAIRDEGLGGGG